MEVPRPSGAGSFELVGHDPLLNRGMNAAIATRGDYVYVGSVSARSGATEAARPRHGGPRPA
jgi:hypothetical protein